MKALRYGFIDQLFPSNFHKKGKQFFPFEQFWTFFDK